MKLKIFITTLVIFFIGTIFVFKNNDGGNVMAESKSNKKVLVAYFSASGTTAKVADRLSKAIGADLFEIKTVKQYPIDYDETTVVAQNEHDSDARPEIIEPLPNISGYDTIIIGHPNWWGTMPKAVMTFLENYDWSGKKVLSFCTHEGSGMGSSENDLKRACKGAEFSKGLPIEGSSANSSDSKVENWPKENGLL